MQETLHLLPQYHRPAFSFSQLQSVTATKRKPCVCPADDLSERMVAPRWVALGSSGGLVPRLRLAGSATGVKTCAATTTTHHFSHQPGRRAQTRPTLKHCPSALEGNVCVNF